MASLPRPVTILMADDDDDDVLLTRRALAEARVANRFERVRDGEELMDYLGRRQGFEDPTTSPEPTLILLDLNMPRKDGRQALREIKADPGLRHIPVIVLTTSGADEDVVCSYDLGVNSFVTKPVGFQKLVAALGVIGRYWFEIVALPTQGRPSGLEER